MRVDKCRKHYFNGMLFRCKMTITWRNARESFLLLTHLCIGCHTPVRPPVRDARQHGLRQSMPRLKVMLNEKNLRRSFVTTVKMRHAPRYARLTRLIADGAVQL